MVAANFSKDLLKKYKKIGDMRKQIFTEINKLSI